MYTGIVAVFKYCCTEKSVSWIIKWEYEKIDLWASLFAKLMKSGLKK